MRSLVANRFALSGLVVLALAALFGVAWVTRPQTGAAQTPARPQVVPVTSAIRSCPAPGAGRVAVFAASGGTGRAQLFAAPGRAPLATVSQPGRLWLSRNGFAAPSTGRRTHSTTAVIVEASGPMAQGLDAEQTTYPLSGSAGVSGVQCAQPGTDFWFLGPGPTRSSRLALHLVNPDSQPAAADVEIFTDTGPLQGNTDTGIAVPPGGNVVQSMAKFTKGARVLALHVRTSVGRVAAAVQAAAGWWRAAAAPATQVVVPGLPRGGTGRRLYLVDPGGDDAQVHVQAITPAGTYEPAGAGGIDVPAGSVVALDLPSLNGIPAALRLRSAVPVTAAVLVSGRAFTAAADPIEQQGVIADNMTGSGYRTSVVLSAPSGAAKVRITMAGPSGPLGAGRLISIRAGHSANVTVFMPRGSRGGLHGFAIIVAPVRGSGPVYAGRVLTPRLGGVQMITPVLSAPSSVTLPALSDAAGAAIG